MAKRWTQRPEGSTWGEWGDNDELGRVNLITSEKVLQGAREIQAGISFCLSLPLDYPGGTALNQRRHPPRLTPTEDMNGTPSVFYNIHMSEMEDWGDPKYVDVWADDDVTLSLQYSTQWDSLLRRCSKACARSRRAGASASACRSTFRAVRRSTSGATRRSLRRPRTWMAPRRSSTTCG